MRIVYSLLFPISLNCISSLEIVQVLMEQRQDSYSNEQLLTGALPLSVSACATECCKRQDCAAFNIRYDMCELLPPSVNALVASKGSTHYRNKYCKYCYNYLYSLKCLHSCFISMYASYRTIFKFETSVIAGYE